MKRSGAALTTDALTHRWPVMLAVAAGVALAVAAVVAATPSRYDATSIIGFTPGVVEDREPVGGDVLRVVVPEYVAAATSERVLTAAEQEAGAPSGSLSASAVDVQLVPDTATVQLVVSDGDPERAARLADAVALALVEEAEGGLLTARMVRPATEPTSAAAPARVLYAAAGVVAGLGLGLAVVLGLEAWRPRVRTTRHLAAVLRAPTVASLTPLPDVPLGSEALRVARLRLSDPHRALHAAGQDRRRNEGVAVVGSGPVDQATVGWIGEGLQESFIAAGRQAELLDVVVPVGAHPAPAGDRRTTDVVLPGIREAGGRGAVCVVPVSGGASSGALDVAHALGRAVVVVARGERESTVASLRTQLRAVGVEVVGGVLVR